MHFISKNENILNHHEVLVLGIKKNIKCEKELCEIKCKMRLSLKKILRKRKDIFIFKNSLVIMRKRANISFINLIFTFYFLILRSSL